MSAIDIQMMIRDQANETRSQLQEVVSWESVIQERDDELIDLARQGKFGYSSPDTARIQATTTTTAAKPKKVQIVTEGEKPKEEEAKVEAPKKQKTVPKSYEEWSKIDGKYKDFDENETDPKETAAEHKEKGNSFYKKKQYASAIKEYTQAINLDSSNAVYYNNRAAAQYQLSNYVESEKDATRAINLDGRYVKAYIRRGNCRRVQGKLQEALKDFEVANELEPHSPEIEKQLANIREQLGISANGLITEIPEPKVKIIQDDDEEKPTKPRIEVIEDEEPPKKTPKIEVIEEKSFSPAEEKQRNQPKIEVVEEVKKGPKIEVIEEKSFSPQEERKRREKEEQAEREKQASSKITIVSEEEPKVTTSSKIKIVSEEEPKVTTSSKIKIVSEEEPTPSAKVTIVSEEEPKKGKVTVVSEEEPTPSSAKVTVVSEEEPKKGKVTVVSEEKKRQPRKDDNIKVTHPELDDKPQQPIKKPVAKKPRMVKPFIDMQMDEYPARMKAMKPAQLNKEIGPDITPEIVINVLKTLQGFEPKLAFDFLEQISQHKYLSLVLAGRQAALVKPLVLELLESSKEISGERKQNVRKIWKLD